MDKAPRREGSYPQIKDVSADVLELCLKISAGIRAIPGICNPGKITVSKESPDEQET